MKIENEDTAIILLHMIPSSIAHGPAHLITHSTIIYKWWREKTSQYFTHAVHWYWFISRWAHMETSFPSTENERQYNRTVIIWCESYHETVFEFPALESAKVFGENFPIISRATQNIEFCDRITIWNRVSYAKLRQTKIDHFNCWLTSQNNKPEHWMDFIFKFVLSPFFSPSIPLAISISFPLSLFLSCTLSPTTRSFARSLVIILIDVIKHFATSTTKWLNFQKKTWFQFKYWTQI